MSYTLQELIDVTQLRSFLDSFCGVSGIAAAIVAGDGTLVAGSGWQDVCLAYHRAHPEPLRCCIDSNKKVAGELEQQGGIIRYTCPHGFVKAAFALVADGEHLGTMFTGQMLIAEPDEERARLTARRYGFDEEGYLAALRKVPIVTPGQLDNSIECLQNLTGLIVGMANAARREKVNARSSTLFARRYASILETTADGFWIIDGEGRCLEANAVCAANLGYSQEELRGMSLREIDGGETSAEMAARTAAIKEEGFGRFEALHRRKDGTLMEVEVSTSYIAEEDLFIAFIRDISAKKQGEEALRRSELHFRSLFESMQEGVALHELILDEGGAPADYRILDVNPAYTTITGIDRHKALGALGSELYGVGIPPYLHEFSRPLVTGCPFSFETYFPPMDAHFRISVFSPGDGQFATVFTNISKSKQAEEYLRQSEHRFRNLFERAPVAYQSIDTDGRLQEVNEAWCRMLGYERSEVIGTWMGSYLAEYARPLLQERITKLDETGSMTGVACQLVRKDGLPVDVIVEGNVSRDTDGRFERTHCILIDVSARKRAEEAVQASRKRLEFLLTATPAVIYTCRASGDFGATFISDNVRHLMGFEPAEFLADSNFWLAHIHEDDRPRIVADLANLFAHGRHSHEYRFLTGDGRYRWMHDELVLVRDRDGNPLECIGCWLDVTDRREAEEEVLRLNEQLEHRVEERTAELEAINRELESFCYSISHDLRAPLRAIDGCTKILQEDYKPLLDGAGKNLCTRIGSNAVRMGALIDDLLTFSRVGRAALELKRLDMTSLVRMTFEEMVSHEERQRIEFHLETLPAAKADATTIGQVWANLLDNAVKYSSKQPGAVIRVTGRQEGDKLVYCVRDNGVGFDMAYSNKLFGVFLRAHSPTEFPGTGVGLAIVERIIHRHGGRVWAEGEEGKGATFCFSLPA